MKTLTEILYESLLDDDSTVLQRADDRKLAYQVNKMLESGKRDKNLIKQLESKVAIYKVDDYFDLRDLIPNYIKLAGNNCSLNWIDVSGIKNMSYMFKNSKFNGDISKWNVSNVDDMSCMFENSKFNGDISKWDVSNVNDMSFMFYNSVFNGDISKWNVSRVVNMDCMFEDSKFNRDISKWDVSNVKYADDTFNRCSIRQEYKPKFK